MAVSENDLAKLQSALDHILKALLAMDRMVSPVVLDGIDKTVRTHLLEAQELLYNRHYALTKISSQGSS